MIPPDSKRLRHDHAETENEDPLSDLPDCVLFHILNFLDAKDVVRTCILSTRWKHLWKRITNLKLLSSDFSTLEIFTKFVSEVLSLRDDSISVRSLIFNHPHPMELPLLERILKYAISHNIQRLGLTLDCEIEKIPYSIFSFQTLTHLSLYIFREESGEESGGTLFPKSLNLPALTGLYLWDFAFSAENDVADPFLTFKKLNHLLLYQCDVRDGLTLRISSPRLVKLSMCCHLRNWLKIVELCTPSLDTFVFTGVPYVSRFKGRNLSSVKHVDIDADLYSICADPAFNLFNWLLDFVGIKSLVLTASTLQVLSFFPDLLKSRLPFLKNLKSLKVLDQELSNPLCWILRVAKLQKIKSKKKAAKLKKEFKANFTRSLPLPDGIVDFLLQNSPSANVDILDLSRYPFVRRSMDLTS